MTPLPRAICSACRRSVPVRRNGTLREHYDEPNVKCDGSGEPPLPPFRSEETVSSALCGPAMEELSREFDGTRWCFVCRTRHRFDLVVTAPIEPSYYGPSTAIVGECGSHDSDLFPGLHRGDG